MFLNSLFSNGISASHNRGNIDDFWFTPVGLPSSSGIRITEEIAMKASAVYACIKVLSETVASLPVNMFARNPDGSVRSVPTHPLQDVINMKPNQNQTAFEFWETVTAFSALWGTSYSEIIAGRRGSVDQLLPLQTERVDPVLQTDGSIRYTITMPDGSTVILNEDKIFKIPGLTFDGLQGIKPTLFGKDAIALSLASEAFGNRFFRNDATPGLVIKHPGTLSSGAQKNLRKTWNRQFRGVNRSHKMAVLEEGMSIEKLTAANTDNQWIEARKFQIEEIARYFRVPLHLIGFLDKSTFSNIEQQSLEFVKFTIRPWLQRIEARIDTTLISNNTVFFSAFSESALLRGDFKTRNEGYKIAIETGYMTRNEIRRLENLNPLPGLDEPLVMLNMGTPGDTTNQAEQAQAFKNLVVGACEKIIKVHHESLASIANAANKQDEDHAKENIFNQKHEALITKGRSYLEATLNPIFDAYNTSMETDYRTEDSLLFIETTFSASIENVESVLIKLENEGVELLTYNIFNQGKDDATNNDMD